MVIQDSFRQPGHITSELSARVLVSSSSALCTWAQRAPPNGNVRRRGRTRSNRLARPVCCSRAALCMSSISDDKSLRKRPIPDFRLLHGEPRTRWSLSPGERGIVSQSMCSCLPAGGGLRTNVPYEIRTSHGRSACSPNLVPHLQTAFLKAFNSHPSKKSSPSHPLVVSLPYLRSCNLLLFH